MPEQAVRHLAKVLGWKVRCRRRSSREHGDVWTLTRHQGTCQHESFSDVVRAIDGEIGMHWAFGRVAELLADILENPLDQRHSKVQAWFVRKDRWGDREGWDLVVPPENRLGEPVPTAWTDEILERLRIDTATGGVLVRSVELEMRQRCARQLRQTMAHFHHKTSARPRL